MNATVGFRAAAVAAIGLAVFPGTAARAADVFAVSQDQMKALGVGLQRLDQPSEIRGVAYPARVTLPPQQERVVSAPVAGSVDQLLVEEHQLVKPGQELLRLNSPEFGELQLAALETANKNKIAQQALERERKLFAEGIIPQRRVVEAEAAASDSRAGLKQASAALRLAGVDEASIAHLIGSGILEDALVLRARSGGVIVDLDVKPGQRVSAADPLLRIADLSKLWLDIQIPADRASAWTRDGRIAIVGRDAQARAVNVGAMVSEGQTISLRAEVISGVASLRPGEFVQAQVPFGNAGEKAWTVPITAVARRGDEARVFVRTTSGFEARAVTIAASAGQSVSVKGDLKSGDEIAVTNVIALKAAWLGESGGQ